MGKIINCPVANFTDLLLDAICMVDVAGRFVYVSTACESIFGYTQEEMIGKVMIDLVMPADRIRTLAAAQNVMNGQPHTSFDNRYIRKDGSLVHIMWSARWSEADQLRIAVARDVTAIKRAEAMQAALYATSEAAHSSEDLPLLFRHIHKIIGSLLPASRIAIALRDEPDQPLRLTYYADESGPIPQIPAVSILFEEVLRRGHSVLLASDTSDYLPNAAQASAGAPQHYRLGVPLTTPQGNIGVLAVESGASDIGYTAQDQDLLVFVAAQVATAVQRKQLITRLHIMAHHDELTQLPNRRLFYDRLRTAFSRAQRQQGQLSLLYVDLNDFKQINDQYGHASGDLVLREAARRFLNCVRETDTVARIGGDEFVVLLENISLREDVVRIRDKIHQALSVPFEPGDGTSLRITASIGIAHFPEHGSDMQELIDYADQSMYGNK
ncbi:MAG: diguanylate cyclase domain-containing protein [Burkholderiales bacterium]